jgi:hypothetical protein
MTFIYSSLPKKLLELQLLTDRSLAFLLIVMAGWSCKGMRQPVSPLSSTAPVRSFVDEPASENWGEYNCDEKGRPKQRLVLSLDVMNAGPEDLPGCMKPLNSDFVLGSIGCVDPVSDKFEDLFAGQLEQICMTNSAIQPHPSDRSLVLSGCKRIRLIGHIFVPALRISGESRDIQ